MRTIFTHRPWYRRIPDSVKVAAGTFALLALVIGGALAIASTEPGKEPEAATVLLAGFGVCIIVFVMGAIVALLED